jgi:hypothetical protein
VLNLDEVEYYPASLEAEVEGIEENVLLERYLGKGSGSDLRLEAALALHHELFVLRKHHRTLRVVSLVLKHWLKPKLGR